jgi:2-methylcitrate dehydratase PrpD
VQSLAIDGFRDLIACMIAGTIEPPVQKATRVALGWGRGTSTIAGLDYAVSGPAAAFANATAAHVLDFDDSFAPLTGHPSAPIVPAILALAEELGASGEALLDAYVVGIEVIAAVARVANPSHYAIGWHSTATIGVIGSAAACARLLGLNTDQTTAAMSIAMSSSAGSRLQLGSPMKSVHAGLAARDALIAARLAAEGVTGSEEVLAGERGFQGLYTRSHAKPEAFAVASDNAPLAIMSPGITFKPYPTCGSTHRSLDALLFLKAKHGLTGESVESVLLSIPALNVKNLIYDRPDNGLEAKFSMAYCAALALYQGSLRLGDFDDDAIGRPQIQALMPRIMMEATPGSEHTNKDYLELPAYTTLRLSDGTTLQDERYDRHGSLASPMSDAEHATKFRDCAGRVFRPSDTESLLDLISNLARTPDIRLFTSMLRKAKKVSGAQPRGEIHVAR